MPLNKKSIWNARYNILVFFYIISRLMQIVEFHLNIHNTIKEKNWHLDAIYNTYLIHQSNSLDILVAYKIPS